MIERLDLGIDGFEQCLVQRARFLDVEGKGQRLPVLDIGDGGAQFVHLGLERLGIDSGAIGARHLRRGEDGEGRAVQRRQLEIAFARPQRLLQFLQRDTAIGHRAEAGVFAQAVLDRQLLRLELRERRALRGQPFGNQRIGGRLPFEQRHAIAQLFDRASDVHGLAEQLRGFVAPTR